MYINNETPNMNTATFTEENFSWKEYSYYHDYLVQLLSYNRKHPDTNSNIWEFSYV